MKTGLTTSVVMHAALLGFGLFSLSAPSAFEVADIESLPVDIVPVESLTKIQQGDKKATLNEKPAPLPTRKPDPVPDAQKIGENSVDTDEGDARAQAAAGRGGSPAEPSPKPEPKPIEEPKPEPVVRAEAGGRARHRADAASLSPSRRSSPTR